MHYLYLWFSSMTWHSVFSPFPHCLSNLFYSKRGWNWFTDSLSSVPFSNMSISTELKKTRNKSLPVCFPCTLIILCSTFSPLQWGDESPLAFVKLSGWFYSWLSITCLVKDKNTCSYWSSINDQLSKPFVQLEQRVHPDHGLFSCLIGKEQRE